MGSQVPAKGKKTKTYRPTINSKQPEPHPNQRLLPDSGGGKEGSKEQQHSQPILTAGRTSRLSEYGRQIPSQLQPLPAAAKLKSRPSPHSIPKTNFRSSHTPDPQRASSRKLCNLLRSLGPRHWVGTLPQPPGFKASIWQSRT